MKPLLDCRHMARLLSQRQELLPPALTRARMTMHLISCQNCRNVDEQLCFLRAAMQRLDPERSFPQPASGRRR